MILRALFFIFLLTNTTLFSQKNNSNSIYGELGNYVIKNYDNVFLNRPEAIRSVIKSSSDNLVYYGTFNGLIEYDGKNIKKINIDGDVEKANRSEYVRNIIESDDGILYLSGPRLIGLLEKNQFGSKQYSSLFNKIPDSINKNRQSFINTLKLDNKIYFSTPERIFRWDG